MIRTKTAKRVQVHLPAIFKVRSIVNELIHIEIEQNPRALKSPKRLLFGLLTRLESRVKGIKKSPHLLKQAREIVNSMNLDEAISWWSQKKIEGRRNIRVDAIIQRFFPDQPADLQKACATELRRKLYYICSN